MKKQIVTIFLVLFFANIFAKNIFVSKNGNDNNSGTEISPYLTISKAAQVAVAGDIVLIKQGVYRERVSPANNGTNGNPIIFKAFGTDEVIVSATEIINNWSVHNSDVYKASVSMNLGTKNMLYFNGTAMDLARWPNNEDNNRYTIDAVPVINGSGSHITANNIPNIDWTGGYFWYLGAHSGASWTREITNATTSRIDFTPVDITKWPFNPHNPTVFRNGNRGRFYLMNALGALDYEREWYYANNTVYFQAPNNTNPSTGSVEYGARETTLDINKDYIEFDGVHCFGGRVYIRGENVTIKNGRFTHCLETVDDLNNTGAQMSIGAIDVAGDNAVIENNIVEYGSSNGIAVNKLWLGGQSPTIRNNVIRHFNTIGNHSSLIRCNANNAKILNNTGYSTGRDGMYVPGTNCEIGYNDFYEAMKINNDGGLFYVVGNPNQKNTEVHHNWFHDSYGPDYADGRCAGIYLDNDSKGYTVHHNVVWNITWSGLQTNWDVWDNDIYNNTIWNVSDAMGAWLPNRSGYQTTIQRTKIYNNYASKEEFLGTDLQNNVIEANSPFENLSERDFTPKAGSSLINSGLEIAGITDGFTGSAPDIGAYERDALYWIPGAEITWVCSKTWYRDVDGDGVGNADDFIETCDQPVGYVANSGDLCLNDGNKTAPGECGCGIPDGACVDEISFTQNITTIPGVINIPVDLDYTVTEGRDLVLVLLDGNGGWVGNRIVTVEQGTGTQRMVISLANAPTPGPSYRLDAYIRPVGGDFTTNITSATKNVSVNQPGLLDCADVVDGIALVDGCGECSGGTTGVEVKNENCVTTPETIDFSLIYNQLETGLTFDIEVNYSANEERDLVVLLNAPDGTWLGNGVKTVPAGSGTAVVTLNVANEPVEGTDYNLGITIRTKGSDWSGNIDTKNTSVELIKTVTGLDKSQVEALEIYPNPTTGVVNFSHAINWTLYSQIGKKLEKGSGKELSLKDYSSGLYFINTENYTFKVMKED